MLQSTYTQRSFSALHLPGQPNYSSDYSDLKILKTIETGKGTLEKGMENF